MEVYWVWSGQPKEGKSEEAVQCLTKLAKYINEAQSKYGHVEITSSLDGKETYHWVSRHGSYALYEEAMKAWEADPRKKSFDLEARDAFTPEGESHFYRVLT